MNPEKIGKQIAERLLLEEFTEKVSLYPGAFKPPHKGHVATTLKAIDDQTDRVIILMSTKERDGVPVEQAQQVWDLYKQNIPELEKVEIVQTPVPVKAVYDYAKDNPTHDIRAVFGKGEQERFQSLLDKEKYPHVEVFDAGMEGTYSATDLRKAIRDNDLEAISEFIPDGINVDDFMSIFQLNEAIVGDEIVCDNCGWNWKIVDGGDDLYICHKCGHDNSPLDEGLYPRYNAKKVQQTRYKASDVYTNDPDALEEADPKKGTGKKPKGSGRRLYTDEDPSDTVKIKFSTRQDIVDTLNKTSFKNKSHARQSQVINLIHQRVRAALGRTKDPLKKAKLKSAFEYIKQRKEASKKKTQRLKNKKENIDPAAQSKHKGNSAPFGSAYELVNEHLKEMGLINEKLCKRGYNYIAKRKREGEKHNPFLTARAVKVCKGQMSGTDGKQKKDFRPKKGKKRSAQGAKPDIVKEIGIKLSNYNGQVLPGDVLRAPKGFPLGGKKLEKSLQLKVLKNSREGVNRYKLSLEDPKTGKKYTVRNFQMDGEYKGEKLPKWGMVRRSKENIDEGDTIEKYSAKGKSTGKLKQGTVRKRLGIPKDKKIPLSLINKELARLRKMDKDPDKKGAQLGDKNQKYYKALQLAKTLKTTTHQNEDRYLQEARYKKFLNEGWDSSKGKVIGDFVNYVSEYLSINKPKIKLINSPDYTQEHHSFGGYLPSEEKIMVVVHNRNMADILRTVAHEMVHHMQNLDDRLTPTSGEDGSPDENEANSLAAVIMRKFGRENPDIYE